MIVLTSQKLVCITPNSIDYMQEVWQTEENYACPLAYHCHQSQLFQQGYGSSMQMINTSPVLSARKHPRNSIVHTSGATQSLYTFCRSPCTLLWCGFALVVEGQCCVNNRQDMRLQMIIVAFRMVKENVLLNLCCQSLHAQIARANYCVCVWQ